ncbi:MAG: ABC transporter substrate-binding protein [Alphaproteobacteria bacterium]|nr:ABC transporter substrate-binding protein [Alphaproteobacteria bacterium]
MLAARAGAGLPTVGYLSGGVKGDGLNTLWTDGMRDGLAQSGFTLPDKLRWLERYAGGGGDYAALQDRLAALAQELIDEGADVILANGGSTRPAIKGAAGKVPVIFGFSGDVISAGITDSLARPPAMATGVTLMMVETNAKRINLLKELLPQTRRISLLSSPNHPGEAGEIEVCRTTVSTVGIEMLYMPVYGRDDIEKALVRSLDAKVDAVVTLQDPVISANRDRLAAWAIEHRLPLVSPWAIMAESGAVMAYGPSVRWCFTRVGALAARILRGAKPGELPIEQPTQYELVVNLRTAQAIGVKVPATLLAVADRTIE